MTELNNVPSCWTAEGFNKVFEEFVKKDITYVEAYRLTEELHIKTFNSLRYKSYESFRNSRKVLIFGK